jgi:site-specific DNA-methyltransferase (cytosine-N4-specific)
MKVLLEKGYTPRLRPSGHDISDKFGTDNGAAIPPNLISLANTESNSAYMRYCTDLGIKPHPARFPVELPEFFIRMLTDEGDLVVDPFGGSCVTGEAAERALREWVCCELVEDYVRGALGRFQQEQPVQYAAPRQRGENGEVFYKAFRPGLVKNGVDAEPLPVDGGAKRPSPRATPNRTQAHPPIQRPAQMELLDAPAPPKRRRPR